MVPRARAAAGRAGTREVCKVRCFARIKRRGLNDTRALTPFRALQACYASATCTPDVGLLSARSMLFVQNYVPRRHI